METIMAVWVFLMLLVCVAGVAFSFKDLASEREANRKAQQELRALMTESSLLKLDQAILNAQLAALRRERMTILGSQRTAA